VRQRRPLACPSDHRSTHKAAFASARWAGRDYLALNLRSGFHRCLPTATMLSAQFPKRLSSRSPRSMPCKASCLLLSQRSIVNNAHDAQQWHRPQRHITPLDCWSRSPQTSQSRHTYLIFTRSWGSRANDPLSQYSPPEALFTPSEKRQYANLIPTNGNLMGSFSIALQVHEENGGKIFTEENLLEITELIGLCTNKDKYLRVELSKKEAKLLYWRRTVDLYKKLVDMGVFHARKDQLESMLRLEREVKPYLTVTSKRKEDAGSRDGVTGYVIVLILSFICVKLGSEVVKLLFGKNPGTDGAPHEGSGQESGDSRRSTANDGHTNEA
jgi:hypothetical protein